MTPRTRDRELVIRKSRRRSTAASWPGCGTRPVLRSQLCAGSLRTPHTQRWWQGDAGPTAVHLNLHPAPPTASTTPAGIPPCLSPAAARRHALGRPLTELCCRRVSAVEAIRGQGGQGRGEGRRTARVEGGRRRRLAGSLAGAAERSRLLACVSEPHATPRRRQGHRAAPERLARKAPRRRDHPLARREHGPAQRGLLGPWTPSLCPRSSIDGGSRAH